MPKLKPIDPLARVRSDSDSVTELELNPTALRNQGFEWEALAEFPRELLECKNLKELTFWRCFRSRVSPIPDDFDRLTSLEKLTISGTWLESLPEAICRLPNLRELRVPHNALLDVLPASIGALTTLEVLELSYTGIKTLPASIGKLARLKHLTLSGGAFTVPPEVFDLTNLESLDLGSDATLPRGLGRLQQLERLKIDAKALAGAASELSTLTRLKHLRVSAAAAPLSPEISHLTSLETLDLCALDLASLPSLDGLTRLASLDVTSNKLRTLAATIAPLPALTKLSFSSNRLPPAEKQLVEALMKLRPEERAAAVAAAATPKRAKSAKPAKPATSKLKKRDLPQRLGNVHAPNAILSVLVAGADVATHFKGLAGNDYTRAREALDENLAAKLSLGSGTGLAFELGVDQGSAGVWELADGRIVIVETIMSDDEAALDDEARAEFHEMIAAPPSAEAKKLGEVKIQDGEDRDLVIAPIQADLSNLGARPRKKSAKVARRCGADDEGLIVSCDSLDWVLFLDPPVDGSWGRGRRCVLVQA